MTRRRRSGSNGGLAVVMVAAAAGAAWYVSRPASEPLDFVDDEPIAIEQTPEAEVEPSGSVSDVHAPGADSEPVAAPPDSSSDSAPAAPAPEPRDEPDAAPVAAADTPRAPSPDVPDDDAPPSDGDGRFEGRFAGRSGLGGQIDVDAIRRRLGLDGPDAITRSAPMIDDDALDTELAGLRARFELSPTDPEALAALVDALVDRGRPDDAWMFVVAFGRAGGDATIGRRHVLRLDPLVDARLDAYARVAELALARVDARDLPRNARRDLDTAAAVRDPLAPGRDGPPEARATVDGQAELVARHAAASDALLDDDDAVEALAVAGAPLPARLAGPPGVDDDEAAERDAEARERGRPHVERGSRLRVTTSVGTRVAWGARRVVEAARDRVKDELRGRGVRSPSGTLEVLVLDGEAAYHTERVRGAELVPPWRLAFHDRAEHRLVALDPAALGEPREALWGHLARETARSHVRELVDARGVLPTWLEEGLVVPYEAARRLGDGSAEIAGWPRERREAVAVAALDGTAAMMRLDEVLMLDPADERGPTWAWALVTYLREARDTDDELLWADRLDDLLDAERDPAGAGVEGAAARAFREHVIAPDAPRAGITSLRGFEEAWHAWITEQSAWIRGDAEALDALLDEAERLRDAREPERAEVLVRRVLSADAFDVRAQALFASLHERAREDDAALLALRNVAALQARPGEPLPVTRLAALDEAFATTLAEHDAQARAALEALVADYLERDFPRAALRVVDRALTAEPLDAGWRATRDTILDVLGDDLLFARNRLGVVATLDGVLGDKSLWEPTGSELVVRCADRKAPTTLNSVTHLRAPWKVSARIEFLPGPDGRLVDERSNYVGLTFGGESPLSDGHWGVFVSPGGRVQAARRADNLEWTSEPLGHAVRGEHPSIVLEVHVDGERFTVFVDGVRLAPRRLGSQPTDGWMSLYAREVDARLSDLVARRPASVRPGDVWHTTPLER